MDDTTLLKAILDQDIGTIANIVQSASELTGPMSERLSKAYHEVTGTDGDPDATITLK